MRVFFIHDMFKSLDKMCSLLKINPNNYNLQWTEDNIDVLIVSERMYFNKWSFEKFLQLRNKANIIVQFLGEAIEPDFNIADYCVGYSKLQYGKRYIHLPSPYTYWGKTFKFALENDLEIPQKTKFCNFIYSNGHAHPRRDELFNVISKYKKVDSLGRHLNNVKNTEVEKRYDNIVKMKTPYKFSIAAENASFVGYTSEKIWTSLAAHTIPIYFGNPKIELEINPKCFINANNMSNENLIETIKTIDNDNEMFMNMLKQPFQTSEQKEIYDNLDKDYYEFIDNLFTGKLQRCRPEGFHVNNYLNFFKRKF